MGGRVAILSASGYKSLGLLAPLAPVAIDGIEGLGSRSTTWRRMASVSRRFWRTMKQPAGSRPRTWRSCWTSSTNCAGRCRRRG